MSPILIRLGLGQHSACGKFSERERERERERESSAKKRMEVRVREQRRKHEDVKKSHVTRGKKLEGALAYVGSKTLFSFD